MSRTFPRLGIAVAVCLVAAIWWSSTRGSGPAIEDARAQPLPAVSQAAAQRMAALEQALRDERSARLMLQERVAALAQALAAVEKRAVSGASPAADADREGAPGPDELGAMLEDYRDRMAVESSDERRLNRLVEGGFDAQTAEWILRRESELQMESLQQRYEARQSGKALDARAMRSSDERLREELGDEDFERYLDATGRPTSVRIDDVLASSPAEAAGLRAGDRIVRYDGERVYAMADLNRLTMAGEPGRSVVLTVVRDGLETRVSIPRGPIGVRVTATHTSPARPR